MNRLELAEALISSSRTLRPAALPLRKAEAEGGCGVIGLASSMPVPGRVLLQPLAQMRNRGNGKGGGVAAAGLDPAFFGVPRRLLRDDYLLAVAYLDRSVRRDLEARFIEPIFEVDRAVDVPAAAEGAGPALDVRPPGVCCYFARVRSDVRRGFMRDQGIPEEHREAAEDEIVFQTSFRVNHSYYSSAGSRRAFVLSHGRDLLVLKLVGYGDDVIRHYGLEDLEAHIWIGHHRYPTKGRVWHPGGAHPFAGLHEALVHNGDFANYASVCSYLAQRGRYPLFLTDTEVAVLLFDILHRVYGYPLEHVIESMAPTVERDFALLPAGKQQVYRLLQVAHIHGSPDGPWFFLVAHSAARAGVFRLIGITDTSMLRPQTFALQHGPRGVGVAASEKQAIDATLESLAAEDSRCWSRADLYWNARGGSHTDGGAFIFSVRPREAEWGLRCTNKFGRPVQVDSSRRSLHGGSGRRAGEGAALARRELCSAELFNEVRRRLPGWEYAELSAFLEELERLALEDSGRDRAFALITLLMDRRCPLGTMKRSCMLSLLDASLDRLVDGIRRSPSPRYACAGSGVREAAGGPEGTVVFDARGFASEGEQALSRALVHARRQGTRRLLVAGARGHRFVGCGLGPASHGVRLDVYGASGDYLASGIDGAEVVVHGTAQDQVAQIMKDGLLVIHGDVGQTFMYAAKGGRVFVLGNAAGRPLINAVGHPHVVINGTCLDYLAESFMAGDPLEGGGFAILNGVAVDEDGNIRDLDTPYPGGNLFSLASGGAIYVRDPDRKLTEDQLNGGEFAELSSKDWELIRPLLEENERILGVPRARLLTVEGTQLPPQLVYRRIQPVEHAALSAEEAWVKQKG